MITEKSFEKLLLTLGFNKNGYSYEKIFPTFNVKLSADFASKELYYPEAVKGRDRNNNFNAPENFVVFECVNRLLEKGYKPEHIELERQWHLGHDAKGGRADICVQNEDGETLFIIECKTSGKEFNKALSDTKNDGAQLFSYWQQENNCKWLVLYASDFQDGKIKYNAPTINCSDDKNLLLTAENDSTIKLYKNSHTVPEKVEAWQATYESKIYDDLIFSDEACAYNIEIKPLRKKNLIGFDESNKEKIINQFEEILRHNNVSDKENAFNRLIALFICKLVDETQTEEDGEVEFQYKQGADTYETLQDRLQRLHKDGMYKFMKEEIFYVDPEYPKQLFSTYKGENRKNAIADLQRTIRNLKYFSNNDFAFKDVHNEELFLQNGKVLVEMVQLFEKFRIVYNSRHQLLGDLFEQLLSEGFTQNEGQFFTPMPITRFIWDCLPVQKIIKSGEKLYYPKIIDYSCGAGHFLTEAVEAVNYFAKNFDGESLEEGDNSWARDSIFGIEKDYRLARVAKISLFMNGAGDGNIIFGDGLESNPDKGIKDGTFDILVANPPYSVKDFIQHLEKSVKDKFLLSKKIRSNGSEIETLFVERIAQLLKSKGIAAVILPSSILSNDSASYTASREQLLENFYIRAVVSFGSKTFSETGTNTVVMFLEKFEQPPRKVDLFADCVNAIFNDDENLKLWQDKEIFENYTSHIGVSQDFYKSFIKRELTFDELSANEYFQMYVNDFAAKKINFKAETQDEQKIEYLQKFYSYVRGIEQEKALYFALVYQQKTLIIKAPADNKEQKNFLGYDWSKRKGKEGIKIIKRGGKLYNDEDRAADDTLAAAVRKTFEGITPVLTEEQKIYASFVNTRDMLDFSRVSFNKAMSLSFNKIEELTSKYPKKDLFEVALLFKGVTFDKKEERLNPTRNIVLTADNITLDGHFEIIKQVYVDDKKEFADVSRLKANDIFICMSSGSKKHVGKVAYITNDTNFYAGGFMGIIRTKENCISRYLYYVLNSPTVKAILSESSSGSNINNLSNKIGTLKIPVPPLDIQEKIVAECQAVDDEYAATRMSIEDYRKKIEEIFNELDVISRGGVTQKVKLSSLCSFNPSKSIVSNLDKNMLVSFIEMASVNENGYIDKKEDRKLGDVIKGGYTYFHENDIIIAKITPCMENGKCAIARGLTNNIGFGSSEFHVFECNDNLNVDFLFGYLNRSSIRKKAAAVMTGASGHRRVPIEFYEDLEIPFLTIEEQSKIVKTVKEFESKIVEAEKKLEALKGKTGEILERYLR